MKRKCRVDVAYPVQVQGEFDARDVISKVHKMIQDIQKTGKRATVLTVYVGCEVTVEHETEEDKTLSADDLRNIRKEALKRFENIGHIEPEVLNTKYKV